MGINGEMSVFARTIMEQKYSRTKKNGKKETWREIAKRVARFTLGAVDADKNLIRETEKIIRQRKFIPGGRYLYACGRPYHQTQNCLLMKAEDSREGWAELMHNASMALMSGAGIGIDYSDIRAEGKPIRKTGGTATGPIALMQMVNEAGRGIMQGGSRRSAIWAGLKWNHPDVQKFIQLKNWEPELRDLKAKDFNFPLAMDGTNISVILDDDFFDAFNNEKNQLHPLAQSVYWATIERMLKTGEPGFSIDTGGNDGECLRNAPVGPDTYIRTSDGYTRIGDIIGEEIIVWTGLRWAKTVFKCTGENVPVVKVNMTGDRSIICDPNHEFILEDGSRIKAQDLKPEMSLKVSLANEDIKIQSNGLEIDKAYTLGYVYGDGSFHKKYPRSEVTLCTDDSKRCLKGFANTLIKSICYEDKRGYTRVYFGNNEIFKNRDKSVFPEDILFADQQHREAFLSGLFDADGNYCESQNRVRVASKHYDFLVGVRRCLESIGILSGISTAGISTYGQSQGYMLTINTEYVNRFKMLCDTNRLNIKECSAYRKTKIKVKSVEDAGYSDVFCCDVRYEEHSFMAEGVIISNCTEVTSRDDSDICNLGSINLARIESLDEMERVVTYATAFLLAGTVYSDVPYPKVDRVRTKNRRLGLGLMGLHEWLLIRGKKYGPDEELAKYLDIYAGSTKIAHEYARKWDLSKPKKTRAIAPTGSIGILGETTTGIEPIFCVAYKRRYLKHTTWNYQYVVDPTAKRLIESGIKPDDIEDAYTLSKEIDRRVGFQEWIQQYVDHGISSTINLPSWGSEFNNADRIQDFGSMLIKYLPKLRGLTCYPDGARGGQPLTPVRYATAIKHVGLVFVESADICDITKGGSCGD